MNPVLYPFRGAVRAALSRPEGGSLAGRFPAPLVTALIAEAAEACAPRVRVALEETLAALAAVGVPRGRQFVLLVHADGSRPAVDVAAWRKALHVPVLVHDPDAASFTAGRSEGGVAIELDDELREAEAIVCVGPGHATTSVVHGGPFLLVPGAAARPTVDAWREARRRGGERAAVELALAVEALLRVDLALTWDPAGRAAVAGGRARFDALAREAGLLPRGA